MTAQGIKLHLPAEIGSVQLARHAVRDQLDGHYDSESLADAELLVSELVTNSIQHGPSGSSWIDVRLRMDSAGLTVEVSDDGAGFDPEQVPDPDPMEPGGWGLALVRGIADDWGTVQKQSRNAVWFRMDRMATSPL